MINHYTLHEVFSNIKIKKFKSVQKIFLILIVGYVTYNWNAVTKNQCEYLVFNIINYILLFRNYIKITEQIIHLCNYVMFMVHMVNFVNLFLEMQKK